MRTRNSNPGLGKYSGLTSFKVFRLLGAWLITGCYLLLTSCNREGSAEWALRAIQNYQDTAEMSLENQVNNVEAIKSALNTEVGLDTLGRTYRKTNDKAYKERLLYICWALTYDAKPNVREKIVGFLKNILENETNSRLRNWAAAGLVQCAAPGMEEVFLDMLKSNQPSMWRGGTRGLLRIDSQYAVTALTNQIKLNRTNTEFVATLKEIVAQESNKWTTAVLQTLGSD